MADSNNPKHKVVAIVGMAGSGKSEVAAVFQQQGYKKIRFGDITDEELRNKGLDVNEENERLVRELFRAEHGMGAYAVLNIPRINVLLHEANVVVDGLYSWEEYLKMKKEYGDRFKLLAVWSSPETRYRRLASRKIRALTREEAESRDMSEIENSDKGGPIAVADYTIINETTLDNLQKQTAKFLEEIK